jgi:hypothetical protein
MDYNTQRKKLQLPEYGRNIHNMVEWVKSLPDKEHRNQQIKAVIAVMGNLNTHLRDVDDFRHKLWDHIQVISNFEIDIDSPYPIPEKSILYTKPKKLYYKPNPLHVPYYGRYIIELIKAVLEIEESEKKQCAILQIANQIKKSYITWNKDSVKDEIIINDLYTLSGGAINLDKNTKLCSGKVIMQPFKPEINAPKKNNDNGFSKNNNNHKNKNNNHSNKKKSKNKNINNYQQNKKTD